MRKLKQAETDLAAAQKGKVILEKMKNMLMFFVSDQLFSFLSLFFSLLNPRTK